MLTCHLKQLTIKNKILDSQSNASIFLTVEPLSGSNNACPNGTRNLTLVVHVYSTIRMFLAPLQQKCQIQSIQFTTIISSTAYECYVLSSPYQLMMTLWKMSHLASIRASACPITAMALWNGLPEEVRQLPPWKSSGGAGRPACLPGLLDSSHLLW